MTSAIQKNAKCSLPLSYFCYINSLSSEVDYIAVLHIKYPLWGDSTACCYHILLCKPELIHGRSISVKCLTTRPRTWWDKELQSVNNVTTQLNVKKNVNKFTASLVFTSISKVITLNTLQWLLNFSEKKNKENYQEEQKTDYCTASEAILHYAVALLVARRHKQRPAALFHQMPTILTGCHLTIVVKAVAIFHKAPWRQASYSSHKTLAFSELSNRFMSAIRRVWQLFSNYQLYTLSNVRSFGRSTLIS